MKRSSTGGYRRMNIEEARKVSNRYKDSKRVFDGDYEIGQADGYIQGYESGLRETIEKCAEIVDRQLDIESETGGEEELTTARNLILKLKRNLQQGQQF